MSLTAATVETLGNAGLDESARRILSLYAEEQLLAYPDLALAAGWFYTGAGETREELLRWTLLMTHYRFEDGPTASGAASLRSSWLTLMSIIAPYGPTEMCRLTEEALRLETEPGDWRANAESSLACWYYLAGHRSWPNERFATRCAAAVRRHAHGGRLLDLEPRRARAHRRR